jgi:hypothetical protein
MGAIGSGRTICGTLVGGLLFVGFFQGSNATDAPEVQDEGRTRAIGSVRRLFDGFAERFGDTDCTTLTGCDWSKKEDRQRYYKEEVYKGTCYTYFEYVLDHCLNEIMDGNPDMGDRS